MGQQWQQWTPTTCWQNSFYQFSKKSNQNYWQLQLDDVGEPDFYPMRYDVVRKYADKTCPSYSSFRLLAQLVPNSGNERATMPPSTESESSKEYICTRPENWTVLNNGAVNLKRD